MRWQKNRSLAVNVACPSGTCVNGCLRAGKGKYGTFLSDITQFYLQYHNSFYGADKIYVHDPTALVACIRKELYSWKQGSIVVATEGALRGKTLMDGALSTGSKWNHASGRSVCHTYSCCLSMDVSLLCCPCDAAAVRVRHICSRPDFTGIRVHCVTLVMSISERLEFRLNCILFGDPASAFSVLFCAF